MEKIELSEAERKARVKASSKYNKSHTVSIHLVLNIKTDADIISVLDKVYSKQGYIKDLIRSDLAKQKE